MLSYIFIYQIKHYCVIHYNVLSPILYAEIFESMKNSWRKCIKLEDFNDENEEIICDLDLASSLPLDISLQPCHRLMQ